MIILTKNGQKTVMPFLQAFEDELYMFQFHGDETYIDPYDGSLWTWGDIDNELDEVLGVVQDDGRMLAITTSESDNKALRGSFRWDDTNGRLFVHWFDGNGDFAVGKDIANYSKLVAGYANGYSKTTHNIYDGVFYDPIISNVSGLSKIADLIKFGLVSLNDSSYSIIDQPNDFDNESGVDAVGNPVWFYLVEDTDRELTDDKRIFTGVDNGYKHNREAQTVKVKETRFFQNVPVCPNVISVDDFPDVGDLDQAIIPTAWGEIRRGIILPTNLDALSEGIRIIGDTTALVLTVENVNDISELVVGQYVSGAGIAAGSKITAIEPVLPDSFRMDIAATATLTNVTIGIFDNDPTVTLLLADSSVDSLKAIDNLYDKDDKVFAGTLTKDLVNCTVTFQLPPNTPPSDLKEWTWQGQGYDIPGDYNNGLDIIKHAYLKLASIPFIASTYDTTTWGTETTANPQSVGISIQSDKGFIESLIEPITTSLQGVVEILGDGRISWASRDISAIPIDDIPIIRAYDQVDIPDINLDPKETVSELFLTFAPNFKNKDDKLPFLYTDDKGTVVANYGISRREPLSPVETILTESADVESLAVEIMATSASPIRRIPVESTKLLLDTRLFGIVGIDTGLLGEENIEYGELLGIEPDYNNYEQMITLRIIPNYTPL